MELSSLDLNDTWEAPKAHTSVALAVGVSELPTEMGETQNLSIPTIQNQQELSSGPLF